MYNSVCFIILSWVFAVLVFPGKTSFLLSLCSLNAVFTSVCPPQLVLHCADVAYYHCFLLSVKKSFLTWLGQPKIKSWFQVSLFLCENLSMLVWRILPQGWQKVPSFPHINLLSFEMTFWFVSRIPTGKWSLSKPFDELDKNAETATTSSVC